MGNKSSTSTSHNGSTTGPPGWLLNKYKDFINQVLKQGQQPFQSYDGQRVAGFTPDQLKAMQGVRDAQGVYKPYYDQANDWLKQGQRPVYETYENYMNPYTQEVVDKTRADFEHQNAAQQSQTVGNAVLKGAMGGDRLGVMQSTMADNQRRQQDPLIAGLFSQGYDKAIAAAQGDASRSLQAAGMSQGLGQAAQGSAYTDANALYGMGSAQQALNQKNLDVDYSNFLEQRAFPYQNLQWMGGLLGGIGPLAGSRTSGWSSTTTPGPSPISQIAGLGLAGAGMFMGNPMMGMQGLGMATGGMQQPSAQPGSYMPWGSQYAPGGFQFQYADGGAVMPYGEVEGLGIPVHALAAGRGLGSAPAPVSSNSRSTTTTKANDILGDALGLASKLTSFSRATGGAVRYRADGGDVLDEGTGMPLFGNDGAYLPPDDGSQFPNFGREQPEDAVPLPPARRRIAASSAPPPPAALPSAPSGGLSLPTGSGMGGMSSAVAPRSGGFFSPEVGKALMAAGFGMMASKSPFAGVAIGEGGLKGLETYGSEQDRARKAALDSINADLAAKRLAQQAQQHAAALAETTRHHKASEARAAANAATAAENGRYSLIPGKGKDADGNVVDGAYKMNAKTGVMEFQAGVMPTTKTDVNQPAKLQNARDIADANNTTRRDIASEGNQTRRDIASEGNDTKRDIAEGNNQTRKEIAADRAKTGVGAPAVLRIADDLQQAAAAEGKPISRTEAIARAQRAPTSERDRTQRERLAQNAAKTDPKSYKDPVGTLNKYRQMYGLETGAPAPAPAPAAKPAPAPEKTGARKASEREMQAARDAIARGAPKDAIIQRFKANGVELTGDL